MEDFETSNGMLKEAGVLVRTVDPSE
jgi:hypothetical protein